MFLGGQVAAPTRLANPPNQRPATRMVVFSNAPVRLHQASISRARSFAMQLVAPDPNCQMPYPAGCAQETERHAVAMRRQGPRAARNVRK
jgi:hypothetical protein